MRIKRFSRTSGFTFVEIIISLAILGIVLLSFLSLFGSGAISIFAMGQKTQAVAEAQSIIDIVTNAKDTSEGFIQSIDPSLTYEKIGDCTNLTTGPFVNKVRYCITDQTFTVNSQNQTQKVMSVLVTYNNGNRYVVVTSVVP